MVEIASTLFATGSILLILLWWRLQSSFTRQSIVWLDEGIPIFWFGIAIGLCTGWLSWQVLAKGLYGHMPLLQTSTIIGLFSILGLQTIVAIFMKDDHSLLGTWNAGALFHICTGWGIISQLETSTSPTYLLSCVLLISLCVLYVWAYMFMKRRVT
jgi:hypothetical protein